MPCLSSIVIIRFLPRLCVLLTLFKLLDALIVSRISSKLCFRISSLTFFFTVFHISTYSMWSLGVSFSIISLRFFIRALVGDDISGFFCFLVCIAMLIGLCWIISVMLIFRHVLLFHFAQRNMAFFKLIECVRPFVFLGITIHETLNWDRFIDDIAKTYIEQFLPKYILKIIYTAH